MSDERKNEIEDVNVDALTDEDLESAAGGAADCTIIIVIKTDSDRSAAPSEGCCTTS